MNTDDIPLDDSATFALLGRGDTVGVFQFESPLMVGLLRKVRPVSILDLSDVSALARPGSLDNGTPAEYVRRRGGSRGPEMHPELDEVLEPILRDSHGVLVYQEQVMRVVSAVTGWSYAEADDILAAMKKKQLDKLERSKPGFFAAGETKGFSRGALNVLWETLIPFASYSFNLSHSVAYAHISYWCAYLKANHPVEFMAALMTSARDVARLTTVTADCARMKIPILTPDINESGSEFTPTKRGIRYGLSSIRDVGESAAACIVAGRPFRTIDDFFRRADPKVLNAGVLEALIKSGSLDSLWSGREILVEQAREISQLALQRRKQRASGQHSIVTARYRPTGQAPKDSRCRAAWELHHLGVELTRAEIRLTPTGNLSPQEWQWVRQVVSGGTQSVYAVVGGQQVKLTTTGLVTPETAVALRSAGIAVTEE